MPRKQKETSVASQMNLPAVIGSLAIASLDLETVVDVLRESSIDSDGISPFDLDRIQFPTAGSVAFGVPTDEGKKRAAEVLEAIVLHHHPIRQYWEGAYDSKAQSAPRCASADGISGTGDPGGLCIKCKYGIFNAECKPYRVLYLLFPESMMPTLLILPRTSLNPAVKYLRKLALSGLYSYGLVTKIGLQERRNGPGMVATFAPGPRLDPKMLAVVKAYATAFKASVKFPAIASGVGSLGDPTQNSDDMLPVNYGPEPDDEDDIDF